MNIGIEKHGAVTAVTLPCPRLDINNATELTEALAPVLAESSSVVMDLREVKFIDSSGFGVILSTRMTVKGAGGDLKISGAASQVKVLFEFTRLHRVFEFYDSVADAVEAFSAKRAEQ
jgi:anti-sigma B factor antagonist